MSEENENAVPCGWVKLWHQAGVLVTLPVPFSLSALMCAQVDDYLANGFAVEMPGAQAEGESKEMIGWVVRATKENRHGEYADVLFLYADNDQLAHSVLTVYLDDDSARRAFEHASGMRLQEIPEYVGSGKIERGKDGRMDRFVIRVPKPFAVIYKPNPRYDPNETETAKKKPKRVFSRWADALPASAVAEPKGPSPATETPADDDLFGDDRPAEYRKAPEPGALTAQCPDCHAPAGAKRHGFGCKAVMGAFK